MHAETETGGPGPPPGGRPGRGPSRPRVGFEHSSQQSLRLTRQSRVPTVSLESAVLHARIVNSIVNSSEPEQPTVEWVLATGSAADGRARRGADDPTLLAATSRNAP